MEVEFLWERSKGLLQNARVIALLEHVKLHPLLIAEQDLLRVAVCVEGVHEDQGDVAAILHVQELSHKSF